MDTNTPPTIQSVAANLTAKAASDLIAVARATPEDKATWQPLGDVRPVLEQLVECCLANRMWTNILQTHVHAGLPEQAARQTYAEIDTLAKAVLHLEETSTELVKVIRALPDANLPVVIAFPWKLETGKPVAECCLHPYWNMTYHQGQINYIQTLDGDWEEHCEAGPFGEVSVKE